MNWQWITGPAVGAVIGYITNDIAVRMMFRPHSEKRLFGRRVPFTPGLIPKERPRLASAIADVLRQEILNPEVVRGALLSERVLSKVESAADSALSGILREERTPRMLLEGLFGAEAFGSFEREAKRAAGFFLMEKILESGIEKTAAEAVVVEAKKRVAGSAAAVLTLFWDDKRSASLEEKLVQVIREMLATHGPSAVDHMIEDAVGAGLDTPVGELARKYGDRMQDARALLLKEYTALIQGGLSGALDVLDLGTIVEDKLNQLDTVELETLIMRIMKKELHAIVWLGGLLGATMGLLNVVADLIL